MTDKTDLQALIELSENELAAMECYAIVKDMRGDLNSSDPNELAELAGMCLNTVIHLGGIVERFRHTAPTLTGAGGGDALDAARWRKARLLPLYVDDPRITPIRPDKMDKFIDSIPEIQK